MSLLLRAAASLASRSRLAAFSSTSIQFSPKSVFPKVLPQLATPAVRSYSKLAKVIKVELDEELQNEASGVPEEFEEMKGKVGFKVASDESGSKEVILTRTNGTETWTVKFSIDDMYNDAEMGDQEGSSEEGAAGGNQGEAEDEEISSATLQFTAVVSRAAADGASLKFDLVAYDAFNEEPDQESGEINLIDIEKVTLQRDGRSEDDNFGPNFTELSEDVQATFQKYLQSNGINNDFAEFLLMYADLKEQREYVSWLNDVHKFASAPTK